MNEPKVTDVAIFKLKDSEGEAFTLLTTRWEAFLKTNAGFVSRQLMQSVQDPAIVYDSIVWENAASGDEAFAKMQRDPLFIKINGMIDSIIHTGRYKPYGHE